MNEYYITRLHYCILPGLGIGYITTVILIQVSILVKPSADSLFSINHPTMNYITRERRPLIINVTRSALRMSKYESENAHPVTNEYSGLSSDIHVNCHVHVRLLLIQRQIPTGPNRMPPILSQRRFKLVQPVAFLVGQEIQYVEQASCPTLCRHDIIRPRVADLLHDGLECR